MNTEQLYQERFNRYVTALRNEKPDRVPIRPFVAEFTAKYAGYTCQEVAHDYPKAFEAAIRCARDFGWDAVVPNMVYVWTGLAQAMGLRYYGIPGIGIPHTVGFNYIEPSEDQAFMKADEYDALIDDPTGFLYNVWFPRVSTEVSRIGESSTYRNNLAFVKGAMAMLTYFYAFGPQTARLRAECGTASAIAGIFKAPFDIIADKLRGYVGLTLDMHTQPKKVLEACEALMPHLCHIGLATSDPNRQVPIGFWMHRGCVPLINPAQYASHYWPTLKPIIEEFWKNGRQTLFYAEGKWQHHFDSFRELPDRSIVFHCDRDDIFEAHRRLHDKFCLSGGIPNGLLSYGRPDEVRAFCTRARRGGLRGRVHHGCQRHHAGRHQHRERARIMTDASAARRVSTPPACMPRRRPPARADVPASVADRAKLGGLAGAPCASGFAPACATRGKTRPLSCLRSRAIRRWCAGCGKRSTAWATCSSGSVC